VNYDCRYDRIRTIRSIDVRSKADDMARLKGELYRLVGYCEDVEQR